MKLYALINSFFLAFVLVAGGCEKSPGDIYVQKQTKLAKAGNYWAKVYLFMAYHHGSNGVTKDQIRAQKWLKQVVKDVSLVRFEPTNGFHPQTPMDMMKTLNQEVHAMGSDQDQTRIGMSGVFRTKNEDGKLIGSFLTNEPDQLAAYINNSHHLKVISVEQITPDSFVSYLDSIQESL